MIQYAGYGINKHLKEVQQKLKDTSAVSSATHVLSELFALVFRERFVASGPAGKFEREEYVASRSNWTYYTALSVHAAAQALNLSCRFEVLGRLDAVIETREAKPQVILLAEWESDYRDLFGKGKELSKLLGGVKAHKGADALLFTYCPENQYLDFAKAVVEYWQGKLPARSHAVLYSLTFLYEQKRPLHFFQCLRTMQVPRREVLLWDDIEA
jgi:hypothetical protein